jgi:hypothetical protein
MMSKTEKKKKLLAQGADKTWPEIAFSADAKDQEDARQRGVTLGVASHRTDILPEASWKGGGRKELDIAFD